ncbi:MAG TPA: SAM-dependent methyltransferase [Lapillicoccus sp.]|nr:SAM-dependent methyltransferase [Lapillicoccus sp.]
MFRDPLALTILGGAADVAVAEARQRPERIPMRIFIAVRHRVAEDALAAAVDRGTRQVVVLGAGLDTFAYRNPFHDKGVHVVEVDHPATQEWKRATLDENGIEVPGTVAYLPVDVETDDLTHRLGTAVDLTEPVFFVWLGVVPYLTRPAVDQTLSVVARVPGATVAFDYPNPVDQLSDRAQAAHDTRAERVKAMGEPWLTYFDTDELDAHLAELGLSVVEDVGPDDIGSRWFGRPPGDAPRRGGHVVVAQT